MKYFIWKIDRENGIPTLYEEGIIIEIKEINFMTDKLSILTEQENKFNWALRFER